ncbi:archaeal proteasome endopeptidase complex subunit beta [Halalkalicoccus salilacus]|uniref:archaeal proteasome endopeptidase complex subunit beta n=1 Tax=Halalkalicoccus TaxID=332246 RepID=UPI002F9640B1
MRTPDHMDFSNGALSSAGQPNPYEPELGTLPDAELPEGADAAELKTGTTTVGLRAEDGVVMATDMRASLGNMVSSKTVQKVEQVHPTGALTIAGSVSAAQSLIDTLQVEANLYDNRRGEVMSMTALSTLTRNLLRSGAFFIVVPVLGGVDDEGPHVYSMDALGGTTEEDYAVSGSGSQFALGVLEQHYDEGLSIDEARDVAIRSVKSAVERDTASGNGLNIATVTGDGVEIERYEDFEGLEQF